MKVIEFHEFNTVFQQHTNKLFKENTVLFQTDTDKDQLWDNYLESFPPGTNELYRKRREHDCSCCRHFVKTYGNIVAIKDNKLISIWDINVEGSQYAPVMNTLSTYVKSRPIANVFLSFEKNLGSEKSLERQEDKIVRTWHHLHAFLPSDKVTRTNKTIPSLQSQYQGTKDVFKRSLEEISLEAIETVLELIAQKSLYKGIEWDAALKVFLKCHKEYHELTEDLKDNYCWSKSVELGRAVGKIKNHSIGVLLTDIDKMDLNDAVKRYEKIVAPTNYKRPKEIFTKKMVENAEKTITELGLLESLPRRHATIDDITINNVLFLNRTREKNDSIFDEMKQEAIVNPKKLHKVEEVFIETFIDQILPTAKNVELMFEGRHNSNLMSLIAPVNKESKTMFKWDNNFSWAYNGNITDSMKELVQNAGGKIDGVLRFSIKWNENGDNENYFDAHCIEPKGNRIFYSHKLNPKTTGQLDVDIINPNGKVAVENITWTNINKMQEGEYQFMVHNYSHRGGFSGFSAEIEYNGEIHSYVWEKDIEAGDFITVAKIMFSREKGIEFIYELPNTLSTKTVWGLKSSQFHKVSAITMSPNYWDKQGVGNRHYMFFMDKCLNPDTPNGFFNEFLKEDLMENKRVFAALGSKMKVAESENQLSGLGFSVTKPNSVFCKVEGSFQRIIKLIF